MVVKQAGSLFYLVQGYGFRVLLDTNGRISITLQPYYFDKVSLESIIAGQSNYADRTLQAIANIIFYLSVVCGTCRPRDHVVFKTAVNMKPYGAVVSQHTKLSLATHI